MLYFCLMKLLCHTFLVWIFWCLNYGFLIVETWNPPGLSAQILYLSLITGFALSFNGIYFFISFLKYVYLWIYSQVVLSQYGGSNKAGFYTVYLNKTGTTNLDGVFNILSYDAVPKLQNILLSTEFKVFFFFTLFWFIKRSHLCRLLVPACPW